MGIFGGNYMKEGPGVDKNAPKKKGFFLFWDIVIQKFTKMLGTNMLHFLFSILYLAFVYIILSGFIIQGLGIDTAISSAAKVGAVDEASVETVEQMLYFMVRAFITVFIFNFFGSGPVTASYAYVMRCYTRGEHTWMMSDGWDKFKENLKQSIPLLIIDVAVILLGMNAYSFYTAFSAEYAGTGMGTFIDMVRYFTVVVLFLYMMMHMYVYQIMVTYKCKFGELMKSAALMTLAKLPMNLLLTVITGAGIMLIFWFIPNPMISLVIYLVIGGVLFRYPLEFYASRVIEKNIKAVKKAEKKNEAKITYID